MREKINNRRSVFVEASSPQTDSEADRRAETSRRFQKEEKISEIIRIFQEVVELSP
jgi:hypothetical protein